MYGSNYINQDEGYGSGIDNGSFNYQKPSSLEQLVFGTNHSNDTHIPSVGCCEYHRVKN